MEKDILLEHKEELEKAKTELGMSIPSDCISIPPNEGMEDENTAVLSNGEVIFFDTEQFTGNTLVELKDKYFKDRKKKATMIAEFDDYYYAMLASRMSGIPLPQILNMKAKDFKIITNFAKNFLSED